MQKTLFALCAALILSGSSLTFAEDADQTPYRPSRKQRRETAIEDLSPGRLWLGLSLGTVVGFGVGEDVEHRFLPMGLTFLSADATGVALLLMGFGDCEASCNNANELPIAGLILLGASRVAQIADLVIFGSEHGMFGGSENPRHRGHVGLEFTPTPDAKGMIAAGKIYF